MKINETKAKKIIKSFNAKFPDLTVTRIYDCEEGTIVKAVTDPTKIKMGMPFYQVFPNGSVVNANPLGRHSFFTTVVQEENMIYNNSDAVEPELPKIKSN